MTRVLAWLLLALAALGLANAGAGSGGVGPSQRTCPTFAQDCR